MASAMPTDGDAAGLAEDASTRIPKYYRLKRHLLSITESMPPGTPVPPERTLSVEFGTSRTTVRQAVHELVVEGRLTRVQGRGTFVAQPKVTQQLQLTSYTEDMRAQGLEPTSRLVEIGFIPADSELASRLAINAGTRVLRIERLRFANGEPMAIEAVHVAASRFPSLRKHLEKNMSLYSALAENYGVRVAQATETIETLPAPPREAALLNTDIGLPMLLLTRHSWDEEHKPVEFVRSLYRGDRYRFTAHLRRPGA
jgi:GntR family transcriptional regulator